MSKIILKKELFYSDGIEIPSTRMSRYIECLDEQSLENNDIDYIKNTKRKDFCQELEKLIEEDKKIDIKIIDNSEENTNIDKDIDRRLDLNGDKIIDTKNIEDNFVILEKIKQKFKKKKENSRSKELEY